MADPNATFTLVFALRSEPDAKPRRRGYGELAEALCEAWLVALHDDRALGIEEDGEEIFDGDELLCIFARIEALLDEDPTGDCRELARRVVEERENWQNGERRGQEG